MSDQLIPSLDSFQYSNICRNRHNCYEEILTQMIRSGRYAVKVYSVVHGIQTLLYKRAALNSE